MAITVKHLKVSAIPDSGDDTLIEPSDWNADHSLEGLGTMAEQDADNVAITGGSITGTSIPAADVTGLGTMATQDADDVAITGGSISGATVSGYIPTTEKGVANGVATLDSGGQVPLSQIPPLGDLNYQGTWDASTNVPVLVSSVGVKGYYYVVNVAGSTNLNGITDWQVGDWAVFSGLVWEKIDNTDAVNSVNGQTGTVVLTTTDIAEGTNEYFTTSRARTSISAGTGISYDNSTGVITNSSPSLGGDVVGPSSATDNAIARFDTTTGKLIQNSVVTVSDTGVIAGAPSISNINYVDFDTTYATTLTEGQLGWDGNNTLGIGMAGGNVVQRIGEDTYIYAKASSTITKGQLCMFTGVVGASSVITAEPSTGVTNGQYIIGLAAESIATNGFGLIQVTGSLKGFDTSAFVDGDVLYYDSANTGGLTKTYPTSGPIVTVCAVTNAAGGGAGSVQIRVSVTQRITASTGISVSQNGTGTTVTNTAPDQTVAISSGTGISVTGTYPNFTVTNTSPSSGGTVTSVTGTAPIASSGGNTPAISISQASGSTDGYLSSTDWTTFNSKGSGSVTSVAASVPSFLSVSGSPITTSGTLAISYSGTALPIANGGTNATSYTAKSGDVAGLVFYNGTSLANDTTVTDVGYDTVLNTFQAKNLQVNNGIVCNNQTVGTSFTIPTGYSATSAGPMTLASGVTVTVPSGSKWVVL